MIIEIPVCACGEKMVPARNDHYFVCWNCDVTQAIEHTIVSFDENGLGVYGERVPTIQDQKYKKEWKKRKIEFYGEDDKS